MNFPVLDLHCDTALHLSWERDGKKPELRSNDGHIDLERGSRIGGYAQCFACFTHPVDKAKRGFDAVEMFRREYDAILGGVAKNPDMVRFARNASEIEKNREIGLISAILTLEGTAGINFDASRLEDLRKEGFCIVSLCWNEQNPLIGSHVTGGGLTDMGKEFLREAQRVGMIVDVSHCSDEAFWDMMKITEGPIIATHSNSRAVHPVSRNITDDMFRAICETGGVAGFNQYTDFIGDNADLDTVSRHILHFMELDPDCNHIALGGDLDGCESLPAGFNGVQDYPKMAQKLLERGVGAENVRKIFWNNALGVIGKCSM